MAMTLVPAAVLAALEVGLRLAGYGHPANFFVRARIDGREVFVENERFGLRFFPPALARSPAPTIMEGQKGTNTYRIFILGESAALGDPEPAFGFGRYLEVLLQQRFPQNRFEVICAAVTAINSHALLPLARECANHDGDIWVIYMGNNEVVGPFGAGTVLGPRAPPLPIIRATIALKATRLGQLLDSFVNRIAAGFRSGASPKTWGGMKMFLNAQSPHDDASRSRTLQYFRKNLEDILRSAQKAHVKVVLSTVASNLKDCAPFASLHSSNLADGPRRSWEQAYHEGIDFENREEWNKAVEKYLEAATMDGEFAELQFRLGRCYLALGDYARGRHCLELARDLDALQFRADSRLNAIIKETGMKLADKGVVLVDATEALAQGEAAMEDDTGTKIRGPPKGILAITGSEVFYEHVHLNFEGNYLLGRAMAEKVIGLLPSLAQGHGKWASAELCDRQLRVTPWDRHRAYERILERETQAPFTLQADHANQMRRISEKLAEIRSHMTKATSEEVRETYRQGLAERRADFYLHSNFALFLEETGDYSGAIREWIRAKELAPRYFGVDFDRGRLLARLGKYAEAEEAFTKSLRQRPDHVDTLDELGQLLIRQKRREEALKWLNRGLRLEPDNARLLMHVGEALAAEHRRDEALEKLSRAVQLRPDYWEARYSLGVELGFRGRDPEASEQFREVVHLKPDYALAHLNLGVSLAKQSRTEAAIEQFHETLRLDPSNRLAQVYLAQMRPKP